MLDGVTAVAGGRGGGEDRVCERVCEAIMCPDVRRWTSADRVRRFLLGGLTLNLLATAKKFENGVETISNQTKLNEYRARPLSRPRTGVPIFEKPQNGSNSTQIPQIS